MIEMDAKIRINGWTVAQVSGIALRAGLTSCDGQICTPFYHRRYKPRALLLNMCWRCWRICHACRALRSVFRADEAWPDDIIVSRSTLKAPMKLIGSHARPYVRKVRIVMADKKLDYA